MESASSSKQRNSSKERATAATKTLAQAGTVLAGGNCPNCGAEMATDQRYCLQCGERRGPSRFPVSSVSAQPVRNGIGAAPRKRSRFSPNATLITGVAALLIAMGTGVLIGRSGDLSKSNGNSGVQVVTAPTGGATDTTATTATTASKSAAKSGGHASATASGSGGEGTATQPLPPATVQPGQSCSAGTAGCKGGKFTGDFFGP